MDPRRAIAVALGAMAGAGIRWAAIRAFGVDSIDAVLLGLNVTGCLALGLISELPPPEVDTHTKALLGAGLCGSLTTWSSLAVETAAGLRGGEWLGASVWLSVNLAVGIGAAVLGRELARRRWAVSR